MNSIAVDKLYAKWLASKENNSPCVIIDVRERQEYVQGHVPGASLVALATVPVRSDAFPKDKDVYIICQMGGRSAQAIQHLMQQGYTNLINVEGGTAAWLTAGYPVD